MSLVGRVCLVTGASRGIGKGCAKALTEQGATVYITGRKLDTLQATANELGKNCRPIVCDHAEADQIEKLFDQISKENNGRLDFLVNNCYAAVTLLLGKEAKGRVDKFWEQDPLIWDTVNNVGLRANYIASVYAARLMVERGNGIIVNMSSPGGLTYLFNTAYGVGKAAQDRMAQDFNVELKGTGVYALSIWPGAVKTELILENVLNVDSESLSVEQQKAKQVFSDAQTTDWVGRTVAQLLDDPNIASKAGRVIWCHDVAEEFAIPENDGSMVPSVRNIQYNLRMAGAYNLANWVPAWMHIPQFLFNFILLQKGSKFKQSKKHQSNI